MNKTSWRVAKGHANRFTIGDATCFPPRRNWLARLWRRLFRRPGLAWIVTDVDHDTGTIRLQTKEEK
jgi:hypothetical protein